MGAQRNTTNKSKKQAVRSRAEERFDELTRGAKQSVGCVLSGILEPWFRGVITFVISHDGRSVPNAKTRTSGIR